MENVLPMTYVHHGISTATRFLQSRYLLPKTARGKRCRPRAIHSPSLPTIGAAIAGAVLVLVGTAAQFRQSTYARSIDTATAAHRRRMLGDKAD